MKGFVLDVHVEIITHLCRSVRGPFLLISVDVIDQTEHQSEQVLQFLKTTTTVS